MLLAEGRSGHGEQGRSGDAHPPQPPTLSASQLAITERTTQIAAPPPATPPPVIPGYELGGELARGGMGVIYRAVHCTLQRTVALKVLRDDLAVDPEYVERFLREARSAARLHHAGVVTVHDAGMADGKLYLAMELASGGDLAHRLDHGPLPQAEAVALGLALAEALAAVHQAGMLHRDLKPENVLIGDDGRPRIADLGLVRADVVGGERMTATGVAMGTPAYMSPEQANGVADLDARTDVYSLGATIYAMGTAQPPFTGPTPWATVAKVIGEPAPDPRSLNAALTPQFAAVVMRCLAKDRAARYQSARELADDLARLRDGRRPLAQSGSVPLAGVLASVPLGLAPRPWWRKRWVHAVVLVYAGVALAALATFGQSAFDHADDDAPHPLDPGAVFAEPALVREISPLLVQRMRPTAVPAVSEPEPARSAGPVPALAVELSELFLPPMPRPIAHVPVAPAVEKTTTPEPVPASRERRLGTVFDVVNGDVARVHRAVRAAVVAKARTPSLDQVDATTAVVESRFSDGDDLRIVLRALDGRRTQIAVQVGERGDSTRSHQLIKWVRDEL